MTTPGWSIWMWWPVCSTDTRCAFGDRVSQHCCPWSHVSLRRRTSDVEVRRNLAVRGGDHGHRQRAERDDLSHFGEGGDHIELLAVSVGWEGIGAETAQDRSGLGAVVRNGAQRGRPRGGGRIDEDESGDLIGEERGKHDCLSTTEGVTDDHVRPWFADRPQQRVKVGRLGAEGRRRGSGVAGSRARPIVRTHSGLGGESGLDSAPTRGVATEARATALSCRPRRCNECAFACHRCRPTDRSLRLAVRRS